LDIAISQEAYERYLQQRNKIHPQNSRLRPDNEDIFDALLSVDMASTPDRRKTLEAIRNLN